MDRVVIKIGVVDTVNVRAYSVEPDNRERLGLRGGRVSDIGCECEVCISDIEIVNTSNPLSAQ